MLQMPKRSMVLDRTDNETTVFLNTDKIWDVECLDGNIDIVWYYDQLY